MVAVIIVLMTAVITLMMAALITLMMVAVIIIMFQVQNRAFRSIIGLQWLQLKTCEEHPSRL